MITRIWRWIVGLLRPRGKTVQGKTRSSAVEPTTVHHHQHRSKRNLRRSLGGWGGEVASRFSAKLS